MHGRLQTSVNLFRCTSASLLTSICGFVKNIDYAIEGRTITDQEIGGWDRVKLGAVGAVEAVLMAAPVGKAAAPVTGKVASKVCSGAVLNSTVANMMTKHITISFDKAATEKLVATRVGQGFLRSYAKVYNSKYNKALLGTTKTEIKVGATASDDAAELALRGTNVKRVVPSRLFGSSKARQISSYAESDLSQFALEFRRTAALGRRGNVVVVEYELNGVTQMEAFSSVGAKGSHAEFVAKRALPSGAKVKRIFTERQPCQIQIPNCDRMLARDFPNAEITFLIQYGDASSRRAGNAALDVLLKEFGL